MNLSNVTFFVVLSLSVSNVIGYAQTFPEPLKLEQAVALAVDADPWLTGSQFTQEALNDEAIAAATLPDPRVSLMAGNFPVDTFDLNQEAMTQLSVGVSQMFPRGDSLALAQHQKQQLAEQHPLLRLDRKAKVSAMVSQLWLEAFKAQESIRLIEHDRALFEQLVDAAEAGYSSALGRARQQDVIRAQLELTRRCSGSNSNPHRNACLNGLARLLCSLWLRYCRRSLFPGNCLHPLLKGPTKIRTINGSVIIRRCGRWNSVSTRRKPVSIWPSRNTSPNGACPSNTVIATTTPWGATEPICSPSA